MAATSSWGTAGPSPNTQCPEVGAGVWRGLGVRGVAEMVGWGGEADGPLARRWWRLWSSLGGVGTAELRTWGMGEGALLQLARGAWSQQGR